MIGTKTLIADAEARNKIFLDIIRKQSKLSKIRDNAVRANIQPIDFIKLESILRKHFDGRLPQTRKRPDKLSQECYDDILNQIPTP